ncbi:MAG TPA: TonB-dependent receptor [Candidatus Angelobacter sp.]|nr:TonB-dependent receptor [Candidatus Angelobacter sp.]
MFQSLLPKPARCMAAISRGIFVLLLGASCLAQSGSGDLSQMNLEQLSKIQVTSVSKKEQKLGDTASAVYVITQEDIRNSGATSLPDVLRMVPGLDVAQINGNRWAVSARGFAEQYADKMLVLIDGRSVFDPIFTGVFWNEQDLMLEDIERIEVIRGPGATLWGSNAVNGVINVITKSSRDTQGVLLTAGAGDRQRMSGTARYGGKLGGSTSYRIYSKYFDYGPSGTISGQPSHDSWRTSSGGFRIDAARSDRNSFVVEGQAFSLASGTDESGVISYTPPYFSNYVDEASYSGQNFMGRWIHKSFTGAETTLQASYAHVAQPETGTNVRGSFTTVSLQHEMRLGSMHDVVFGTEYDFREAQTSFSLPIVWWTPSDPKYGVASGFVQDEMLFRNGQFHFTAGLRLEHNSLSGVVLQPNLRGLWKVNARNSVWLAYSLGNRSPSISDEDMQVNVAAFPSPAGTKVLRLVGASVDSEKVHAFELGYRAEPAKTVALDFATFLNHYWNLLGQVPGQPFFESGPPARLVIPLLRQNNISGDTFGGEMAATWTPVSSLKVRAAYSLTEMDLFEHVPSGNGDVSMIEGMTPRHQLYMASSLKMPRHFTFNNSLRFVDRRTAQPMVPGYTQVDSNLSWKQGAALEFTAGAKNLLNKQHIEFITQEGGVSTALGRSVYGKVTWHF